MKSGLGSCFLLFLSMPITWGLCENINYDSDWGLRCCISNKLSGNANTTCCLYMNCI